MFTSALGWAAAAFAAIVALPQVIRLLRTKAVGGISPGAWQIILSANLAWLAHGVYTGYPNIWVPNLIFATCSATILWQLAQHAQRRAAGLLLPSLAVAAGTFGLELGAGALAFAVAAFLPSGLAQLAQLRALVVSPSIRGVSMAFLALNVVNQVLWVSWALLAREQSVALVGCSIGTLMLVNLVWATLRHRGLVRARLALRSF